MANQLSKNKIRVSIAIEKTIIKRIDNEADIKGRTRSDIIKKALRQYLKIDPIPASSNDIEELKNLNIFLNQKLDSIMQQNKELKEGQEVNKTLPDPVKKKGFFARLLGK